MDKDALWERIQKDIQKQKEERFNKYPEEIASKDSNAKALNSIFDDLNKMKDKERENEKLYQDIRKEQEDLGTFEASDNLREYNEIMLTNGVTTIEQLKEYRDSLEELPFSEETDAEIKRADRLISHMEENQTYYLTDNDFEFEEESDLDDTDRRSGKYHSRHEVGQEDIINLTSPYDTSAKNQRIALDDDIERLDKEELEEIQLREDIEEDIGEDIEMNEEDMDIGNR